VKQEGQRIVSLHYQTLRRVNFASAQNDVAIVERLAINNAADGPLTDVRLTLRAAPPIIREKVWIVDRIAGESEFEIRDVSTDLDLERLAGLDEAEIGELEFRVEAKGRPTLVEKCRIDLLARDEWGGVRDMAQILAAFVSPNDPAVAKVVKEAARLLEAAGHDGSLNGYQTGDPRRAYLLAASIWSAVTGLALTYAEPPASFEREGQKIRGPGRITGEGLATCLDATLFLAATFEAVGLNPVVFFSQGHAWVGVWILDRDFNHVTEPDAVAVRKAVQARELVPIETTLLTRRPPIGFDQAVDEGRRRLSENRDPEFMMAVDIRRSRSAKIRPLASHRVVNPPEDVSSDEVVPAVLPPLPDFGLLPSEIADEAPEIPRNRVERWQRKLLDLSLRNRLLNYRDSKQTLPLRCPEVGALEDALAAGRKFRGFSLTDEAPVGNRTVSPEEAQRIEEGVILDAFARSQFGVPLTTKEMNVRLLTLNRRARSDLQEGGTNTLFLAAGFLRWKKTEGDTRTYRAPLVLIPVRLERRSAQSPFYLSHHEDDPRFNLTLLEFLKRDFALQIPELGGDLPRDESGIDLPLIFETMRRKVRDIAGFEVVEELALSTFSFAKYLMWKDLVDREDQLRQNRLVRHLIEGAERSYEDSDSGASIEPEEMDWRRVPRDLLTPLPVDSSQLAAVVAASEGRDFILIGPPGTGKSQTIANIIAQCLGEAKTVLFVAEKAAALDVVHRRLVATGLGDAVLELHSNKTDRKVVLGQLGRGWDRSAGTTKEEWIQVTEELRISRDRLNGYVQALHAKGSQGFSVFEAVARVASGKAPFEISFASKDAHDEDSYRDLVSVATQLGQTHAVVGKGPALHLVRGEQWSFKWEAQLLEAAETLRGALVDLEHAEHVLARELGLRPDPDIEATRRTRLKALAPRMESAAIDLAVVPDLPAGKLSALAEALSTDVLERGGALLRTAASYPLEVVRSMPLEQLDAGWREARTKFWPASAFARRKLRKLLQTYASNGAADPAVDLKALFAVRERDADIGANPLAEIAGTPDGTNAERASEAVRQAIEFRKAAADLRAEMEDPIRYDSAMNILGSVSAGAVLDALKTYLAAEDMTSEKTRAFEQKGGDVPDEWSVAETATGLATVLTERARLGDWARWMEESNRARSRGLGPLVEALEAGCIEGAAEGAFERAYAAWWLPPAMEADDELSRFLHWDHENRIEAFRSLDDTAAKLAPLEVMRRIAHGLPSKDGVPRKSELGTLRHQLGLKRPSMPIRQLLANLPETFGKLAPCVLMSPLSVAQYLPADQASFDLVVFDEASQVTTWDAIGAIARARQTIIVGDPMQLPPTNFFGRADDDDEELPEVDRDLPSILDEVSAAGIRHRRLDWHYRSRDEALIAFSNHFYYGGRLVTFPAPATGSEALKFHKVEGTYSRGGARVNETEAKAIAAMAKQRLATWLAVPEGDRQTLGVITFNSEQQSLVEDFLDKVRQGDSRLEWFFSDEREEPVIVKNLESIQGDERDVMLFSVTFGPDIAGKITMNFGPINGTGGERRLNVAITRARRELHVFSSIRAEQIDLGRTRAVGVKHLKNFLDYAERGTVALPARDEGSLGPAESPFEEAVAEALRATGWEVRTQIGVSGFRVDLGVVHPDFAGAYLAGIECDGARYHSSATARDRDKLRQVVLEGLGWTILRVWSTDWFRNPSTVAERIHNALGGLLDANREARAATEANTGEELCDEASTSAQDGSPEDLQSVPSVIDDGPLTHEAETDSESEEPLEKFGVDASARSASPGEEDSRTSEAFVADPERFFDRVYTLPLRRMILSIVEREGPMTLHRLARRVAQEHGWQRTGKRIQRRVETNLGQVELHTEFGTTFVWAPSSYSNRVPFRGMDGRTIREVSRAEIASVIDVRTSELARAADPILDLSRFLGIYRLSKDAREYLSDCARWQAESAVSGTS